MQKIFVLSVVFLNILLQASRAEDVYVEAMVNGVEITSKQVDDAAARYVPQTYYHRQVSKEKIEEFRKRALQDVIDEELEYQEAKRQGIKVSGSEIKEEMEKVKKNYVSKKAFEFALSKEGLTIQTLEARIERIFLVKRVYDKEVASKVRDIIADKYLLDYYEKNKDKFREPEKARVRHILIKPDVSKDSIGWEEAKIKADEVWARIKGGADFSDMAWKYSVDDYRVKGGDMGFVHRGVLVSEIENTVFNLKTGEVSKPFKSEQGYHIVMLVEKKDAVQLEFSQVMDKIKRTLENTMTADIKGRWLKDLRDRAKIEIIPKR